MGDFKTSVGLFGTDAPTGWVGLGWVEVKSFHPLDGWLVTHFLVKMMDVSGSVNLVYMYISSVSIYDWSSGKFWYDCFKGWVKHSQNDHSTSFHWHGVKQCRMIGHLTILVSHDISPRKSHTSLRNAFSTTYVSFDIVLGCLSLTFVCTKIFISSRPCSFCFYKALFSFQPKGPEPNQWNQGTWTLIP